MVGVQGVGRGLTGHLMHHSCLLIELFLKNIDIVRIKNVNSLAKTRMVSEILTKA